jgi:hypothetical protein
MSNAYPPIHRFQQQVENLRKHLADKGLPITHAQALQAVAEQEGLNSWDYLPSEPKRHWLARRLGWGNIWKRSCVQNVDELLFDVNVNWFKLGVAEDVKKPNRSEKPIDLDLSWARRHILFVGPHGKGATTAAEYYAGQQIAAGGGCLILDTAPYDGGPNLLETIALACGRPDFKRYRYDLPEQERSSDAQTLDVRALVTNQHAAYVSLPSDSGSLVAKTLAADLLKKLEEVGRERLNRYGANAPRPFLVMLPQDASLIDEDWKSFLELARGYGMVVFLRLFSLTDLGRFTDDLAQIIQSFGTKLFLQPDSPSSLEAAAQMIALSQEPEKLALARKSLANLGLGEALRPWPDWKREEGHPSARTSAKLVHVRLCMVSKETRQEARERWDKERT